MKRYLIINPIIAMGIAFGGYFVGKKVLKKHTKFAGDLIVEENEEPLNPPYLYLALDKDANRLKNCEIVMLRVIKKK